MYDNRIKIKKEISKNFFSNRKCFYCKKNLKFKEFYLANVKLSFEAKTKIWLNKNIELLCCDCYSEEIIKEVISTLSKEEYEAIKFIEVQLNTKLNIKLENYYLIVSEYKGYYKLKKDHIIELNLHGYRLKTFPKTITNLKYLRKLDLSYNSFTYLPKSFKSLNNLRELNLCYNNFKYFPKSILELKNLRNLDLSINFLIYIPESIDKMSSLRKLDLNNTQLMQLPDSIGNLRHLRKLDLYFNKLSNIPENIGNLSSLNTIILGYNDLRKLPKSLGKLQSLKTLNLEGNKIIHLPNTISDLKALRTLLIDYNCSVFSSNTIMQIQSLKTLIIYCHCLEKFPQSVVLTFIPKPQKPSFTHPNFLRISEKNLEFFKTTNKTYWKFNTIYDFLKNLYFKGVRIRLKHYIPSS